MSAVRWPWKMSSWAPCHRHHPDNNSDGLLCLMSCPHSVRLPKFNKKSTQQTSASSSLRLVAEKNPWRIFYFDESSFVSETYKTERCQLYFMFWLLLNLMTYCEQLEIKRDTVRIHCLMSDVIRCWHNRLMQCSTYALFLASWMYIFIKSRSNISRSSSASSSLCWSVVFHDGSATSRVRGLSRKFTNLLWHKQSAVQSETWPNFKMLMNHKVKFYFLFVSGVRDLLK